MSDGDIVHGRPNYYYKKPYEAVCEGKLDYTEKAITALWKDIKNRGADFVILAKCMGEYSAQMIQNEQINWGDLNKKLEEIKNKFSGSLSYYSKEIILRGAQTILHELKYGDRTQTNNLPEVFVGQSMKEIYESQFEAKIDLNSDHHNNIDPQLLIERVQDIRPEIENVIDENWAKKATKDEDVNQLTRPNRKNKIDIGENLR